MRCKEFQDISESFLSDELLVETNHQVNNHLEHCADCRRDFFERKNLRNQVRLAAHNSTDFKMDPAFSMRLAEALKAEALGSERSFRTLLRPWVIAPVAAALVIASIVILPYFRSAPIVYDIASNADQSPAYRFAEFSANDHRDCALEKLHMWESEEAKRFPIKAEYASLVKTALSAESETAEVLSAHDCLFEGQPFTHVIVKSEGHIFSIYMKDGIQESSTSEYPQVASGHFNGFVVTSFFVGDQPVSVVSEMAEEQNRKIAKSIASRFV